MRTVILMALCLFVVGCNEPPGESEMPPGSKLVYSYDRDGPLDIGPDGKTTLPDGTVVKIKMQCTPGMEEENPKVNTMIRIEE